ncbi:MAG TPA: VCBS repeat-containing protein, partial [Chitinophagaceae bacterium]|nr:VCBS repeat-containing protein [Chitinophagaceae bacterium]
QTTLPHKLSQYNPAMAAGDIDGNGLDDILVGGNPTFHAQVLLQQPGGRFTQKDFIQANEAGFPTDEGILLFDANGDGHKDVYIASGGYKAKAGENSYQDRLYINDGKGHFTRDSLALPLNHSSKLCVRAMDYNNDGKLDLFVSGRVNPWNYPKPVSSFIYRNDSKDGRVQFTDVTATVAPDLINIGMVCDALCTDFDNDNQVDLLLAGEWMPVTFLKNEGGKFVNVSAASGISSQTGWWNSIVAGDFRHTGRTDYILGNTGLNTLYKASDAMPVHMTAKDFDHNGSYVPIPSLFLPAKDGSLQEFPAFGRDDIVERIPTLKKRFNDYKKFAEANMQTIFTPDMMQGAQRLTATQLQSCFLRNDGNGKFTLLPLPKQAQFSALNGMLSGDFDDDGQLDVLISGNDFGTEVSIGRLDALNGLLLKGDGKGGFLPLSILQSGVYIPGDGKALSGLVNSNGHYQVAATQNRNVMKLFELKAQKTFIKVNDDDQFAILHYKDGSNSKQEFYFGDSFLSQSARYCVADKNVNSITITNTRGVSRNLAVK